MDMAMNLVIWLETHISLYIIVHFVENFSNNLPKYKFGIFNGN
jgi:hypothetical protein